MDDHRGSKFSSRVGSLIASKFRAPGLPAADATTTITTTTSLSHGDGNEYVDCRAYYPLDAWSDTRKYEISPKNPLGTSCLVVNGRKPYFDQEENKTATNSGMFNVTNGCSCNFEQVPGNDFAGALLRAGFASNRSIESMSYMSKYYMCWYPNTTRGIKEVIDASNNLYLNRSKLYPFPNPVPRYLGWTECSASPNVEEVRMADAIVIEPPSGFLTSGRQIQTQKRGNDNGDKSPSFSVPWKKLSLPIKNAATAIGYNTRCWNSPHCHMAPPEHASSKELEAVATLRKWNDDSAKKMEVFLNILRSNMQRSVIHYRGLPVIVLQEANGDDNFWKEFVSREFFFGDGSCVARVNGDDEARFYGSKSKVCRGYKD